MSAVSTGSQTRIRLRTATPSSSSSTRTCTWQPQVSISPAVVPNASSSRPYRSPSVGDRLDGDRRRGQGGDPRPDGDGGGVGPPRQCRSSASTSARVRQTGVPSSSCCALSSGTRWAPSGGVGTLLLGPVVLLGGLPLPAPGRDLESASGPEWHRAARGVDHEQFFLDPDGAHPLMISQRGSRPHRDRIRCHSDRVDVLLPLCPTVMPALSTGPPVPPPPGHLPTARRSRDCCDAARRAAEAVFGR